MLVIEILAHLLSMKPKSVMFISFDGQYNDNPKYISEALYRLNTNINIYWALNESSTGKPPGYVIPVIYDSVRYYILRARMKAVVDNYTGIRAIRKNKPLMRTVYLRKRKNQLNISTWHGTPLKKIHADINNKQISPEGVFTTCDLFISGNKHTSEVINRNLCNKLNIMEIGSPRNDSLLKEYTPIEIAGIKRRLYIPEDKKTVLFAPTFRDNIYDSGLAQLKQIDVPLLLETLHDKFGGDWSFVFRAHPGVTEKLKGGNQEEIYNGNISQDMTEYLITADVLITDYSGSLFDFALTDRPCFLFAHDFDHYSKVERGLYMKISDLPYTFTASFDELINVIKQYDHSEQQAYKREFLRRIGNCESGEASVKTAQIIINKLFG